MEGSGHFRLCISIRNGGDCHKENVRVSVTESRSIDHNKKSEKGRTCGRQSREERCIQEFGE